MICEILVALQGRVDAARLFGQRLEQILFKLGARRSTWDPKAYFFHFGPLTDTAATLDEVLAACQKVEKGNDKNGCPNGWAVLAVHVDDCPGIASSPQEADADAPPRAPYPGPVPPVPMSPLPRCRCRRR